MNAPKLTPAQVTALRYYRALADKASKEEKKALRYRHHPTPVNKLYELGYLEVVERIYGGLCAITDAGREELKRLGF